MNQWTFLTNHTHVLIAIQRNPQEKLRQIAELVGITERSAHRIVTELIEYGVLSVEKDGRRNRYIVHADKPLRHPMEGTQTVQDLLMLARQEEAPQKGR